MAGEILSEQRRNLVGRIAFLPRSREHVPTLRDRLAAGFVPFLVAVGLTYGLIRSVETSVDDSQQAVLGSDLRVFPAKCTHSIQGDLILGIGIESSLNIDQKAGATVSLHAPNNPYVRIIKYFYPGTAFPKNLHYNYDVPPETSQSLPFLQVIPPQVFKVRVIRGTTEPKISDFGKLIIEKEFEKKCLTTADMD